MDMNSKIDENLELKLLTLGLWNLTVDEGKPETEEH
jgi:hypothetical protein